MYIVASFQGGFEYRCGLIKANEKPSLGRRGFDHFLQTTLPRSQYYADLRSGLGRRLGTAHARIISGNSCNVSQRIKSVATA